MYNILHSIKIIRNLEAKDPKLFNSMNIEWSRDYLKHFLKVSEWNDWDDHEMVEQLTMAFDGEALTILGELDNNILRNLEILITELNRII